MPRTGAPAMIGETPTMLAAAAASASRMPGTASTVPIDTTGFDGGSRITSAVEIACSTAGVGLASAAPTATMLCAGSAA